MTDFFYQMTFFFQSSTIISPPFNSTIYLSLDLGIPTVSRWLVRLSGSNAVLAIGLIHFDIMVVRMSVLLGHIQSLPCIDCQPLHRVRALRSLLITP